MCLYVLAKYLTFKYHPEDLKLKLNRAKCLLSKISYFIKFPWLRAIHYTLSDTHLNYGYQIWGHNSDVSRLFGRLVHFTMHVKKRLQSEKKKLPTKMFSSIYIQKRSQKCTTKYLYCFVWFLLYHMLHLSYPDFTALTSLWPYNLFFFFNMWIFKNLPQRRPTIVVPLRVQCMYWSAHKIWICHCRTKVKLLKQLKGHKIKHCSY